MEVGALVSKVDGYTRRSVEEPRSGRDTDPVPGLRLFRRESPTGFETSVYDPLVCLILQGSKQTKIGDRTYRVQSGDSIVVSHGLPVASRILEASPEVPYLGLIARLDLSELRNLDHEVRSSESVEEPSAYAIGPIDAPLLDVMARYLALVEDPQAVRVLTPIVRRELHFRLLVGGQGAMLRTLLRRDSHASQIARAIEQLRLDFRETLEIPQLARSVGMSTSAFHKHFKHVTATTPLQYQKDLRLTEARRLLMRGTYSVSTAAFEVGYESPTQFSREYSRKYGRPPSTVLAAVG